MPDKVIHLNKSWKLQKRSSQVATRQGCEEVQHVAEKVQQMCLYIDVKLTYQNCAVKLPSST